MTTYLASSTRDLGTRLRDNMKTQLKWRHRNIPYICTYFTPGFLAPGGTIFQHTVHDALRFFTSIALITCCAILISALYFTLPLSLAASHRTLNESSRTRIKLEILHLGFSSLSLLLHSVYDYALRSVFFLYSIERFHSRREQVCNIIATKERVYIWKEYHSHRTGLRHQHGRQQGGREVIWKGFIPQKLL